MILFVKIDKAIIHYCLMESNSKYISVMLSMHSYVIILTDGLIRRFIALNTIMS